jgi:hypothetical protein
VRAKRVREKEAQKGWEAPPSADTPLVLQEWEKGTQTEVYPEQGCRWVSSTPEVSSR